MLSGLAASTRRALATLVAGAALLCAQLAALPDTGVSGSAPTAVATSVQASVGRVQGGNVLVKTERTSTNAKQAPQHDFFVPLFPIHAYPQRQPEARGSVPLRAQSRATASPYSARAPPGTPALDLSYTL